MSRYIDADALIAKMPTVMDMQDTYLPIHFKEWLIDTAPSIDIVRCGECVYCVDAGAQKALICDNSYIDMDIHPDDFCSYGERREP